MMSRVARRAAVLCSLAWLALAPGTAARQQSSPLVAGPLVFGVFTAEFRLDGTFSLTGSGWPAFDGTWKLQGTRVELVTVTPKAPPDCAGPGRYVLSTAGTRVSFTVAEDACTPRRMILDGSTWRPGGDAEPSPSRTITRTAAATLRPLPAAETGRANWPSFRGREASGVADGQQLPDRWNADTGENIIWRTVIPGLRHSSPIVWGDRLYVTAALSQDPKATFKPGLYGDGDASADRSPQKWVLLALDKRTGRVAWQRVAHEGVPRNKRHMKSTYASATPATDGRIVVAWFGSEGVYAFNMDGSPRWKVDIGRVNMGAYDIPTYEWGPASSPIIWNDLVIIQCDTQADSFLLALDVATGNTVWKTDRDELPSWGTPTVVSTPAGPELVTNAANAVRGYDPRTGKERWRLGRSSKITAPTPFAADGLIVVASGRAPERPLFVIRPGARGDITPAAGESASAGLAWSRTARGSYMPTPLAYGGLLYVLGNNGVFDAYVLQTGEEIYHRGQESRHADCAGHACGPHWNQPSRGGRPGQHHAGTQYRPASP
jgi:outer membrane protein assembly factor BamB